VRYNSNFSAETFDRLKAEKQRLKAARKHALERAHHESAETMSLNRRIAALDKVMTEIIAHKT
jgi:hypothetical protein